MDSEFQRELTLLQQDGLKTNPMRLAYEEKVRGLQALKEELLAQGCPTEELAHRLHTQRRELGRLYKEMAPPLFRAYIYYATAQKYGDPLGPDYEQLRKGKTPEEIIASATRPIADLDQRLTLDGFIRWFEQVYTPNQNA